MIPLKLVLQSVEKGLKVLTRKTEEMQKFLDKLATPEAGDRAKREPEGEKTPAGAAAKTASKQRPTKKRGKPSKALTDTEAVLNVIRKSEAGATTLSPSRRAQTARRSQVRFKPLKNPEA